MSRQQALDLLMLLSALESWSFSAKCDLPDYLHQTLSDQIAGLREIVLGAGNAKVSRRSSAAPDGCGEPGATNAHT